MAYRKDTPENVEREIEKAARLLRTLAEQFGRTPTTREYQQVRIENGCAYFDYFTANGVKWPDIVQRAGLAVRTSGQTVSHMDTEAVIEREIAETYTERRKHDLRHREWPLQAIHTRTEVCEYPLGDGSGVYRVTRTYASLR